MGYLTYFTLNKVSGNDAEFEALVTDIKEKTGIDFSRDNSAEAKWYDCEKDMTALSRNYPDLVVQLDGDGENSDDLWSERFRNGECECVGMEMSDFVGIATDAERRRFLRRVIPEAKRRLVLLIDALLSERGEGRTEMDLVIRESERTVTTVTGVTRKGEGVDIWLSQRCRDEPAGEGRPVDGENLSVDELYSIACSMLN